MPSEVRFAELKKQLESHGWSLNRVRGSHHYFTGPGRQPISIPVHKGKVKNVYRKQVQQAINDLNQGDQAEG